VLWLKAFHIVFVVTWFAGLFYLPRLFVYHALAPEPSARERFGVMERRLFGIMTIGGTLAAAFGVALIVRNPALLETGWLRVKLVLVAGLIAYHVFCRKLMAELAAGRARSDRWYRWYNEVPALALVAIVVLAVVRPL
jgi:putative membrane protein